MIVIKPPYDNFVRLDRSIIKSRTLSDGAVRLYGYLASLRQGSKYSDEQTIEDLGIGEATLYRRKGELKNQDLICTQQLAPRVYIIFIGTSKYKASAVKAEWNEGRNKKEAKND